MLALLTFRLVRFFHFWRPGDNLKGNGFAGSQTKKLDSLDKYFR